jgi:hypothetical protein
MIYPPAAFIIGGLGALVVIGMVRARFLFTSSRFCHWHFVISSTHQLDLEFCVRLMWTVAPFYSFFSRTCFPSFTQDTSFSTVVTALFLRPIYKVMGEGGAAVQESAGHKSMQKTKWMTLAGSTIAVLSSSALYVNAILWMFLGESDNIWYDSPYLNYGVFGMNLDSVLNDVGMLLACGVLKKIPSLDLTTRWSARSAHKIDIVPQPVFDSQAYEGHNSRGNVSSVEL